jgi:NAD(P)-dependent dehydrogenase (short-subunit alcohol dehydrogenase family)
MTETTNRVAIVTGASRGLGEVVARVLAGRGYHLVVAREIRRRCRTWPTRSPRDGGRGAGGR